MKKFFLLLFISLFFLSCGDILSPAFDEPVRAYFEEYTNNAAIEKHTFPSGVENPDGILCVTSESDGVISFEMRNPQKYLLNFDFDFSESEIKDFVESSDYSFTQASDRAGGTLTFSRDFLNRVDAGNLAGKNISGSITIVEPKSGRSFKSYPISLHANTAPPSVQGAAFQRSSESDDAKYIVCFFMPNMNHNLMALHTRDTHVIYVNGEKKYTKQGLIYNSGTKDEDGNWTISDLDSNFSSSAPTMYSLTGETDAFTFDSSKCPEGYSPLYYITDEPVTTETKTCTLTILDDDGLSSSVAISNKASQLNPPAFSVESSTSYGADEDTGLYAIKITHDGLCTDGSSSGSVTINYTITETTGALVFNNGSASSITSSSFGSATIYLPQGTYSVTAAASKNYYITSEEVTKTSVKITQSAVFYVSQNGSDSLNTGKRASPYRTIDKATDAFTEGILSALYESDAECIIYVMSDLTPPDDFTGNTFINIPTLSNSIKIIGYGAVRTIDAKGNSSNSRRLLYAPLSSGAKLTIKNINLKGGYIYDASLDAAVHFYCDFEMIGGSITGCMAQNKNVIKVNFGTGLFDGVTISGNKVLTEDNSVLYIAGSLTLKDSSIINNTAENSAVILSAVGSLTVSGKVNIYNSKKSDGTAASNLYMPTGSVITVDGNISGSKIGVNVPWQPSDAGAPRIGVPVAFTSGYGYGTTNSSLPGEIFIAENGYGISTDSSGEAAFAVSGGGMYTALDYTVNLTASSVKAALNKAKTVTVAVSGTRKEPSGATTDLYYNNEDGKFYTDSDLTTEAAGDNTVDFAAALYNGATKVSDCEVAAASETGKILVTVPAIAYEDIYTIRVTSTFLGVTKDTSVLVLVSGNAYEIAEIIPTLTESTTLNVTGTINSEALDAIKAALESLFLTQSSSVQITLDLSGTTGLTEIADNQFYGCYNLGSIILPSSVTSIGESAFEGCRYLTSLPNLDNVTSIGKKAFNNCDSFTEVTLPDSVTSVGSYFVYNYYKLKSIVFSNNITELPGYCVYYMGALTSITLPRNLTKIKAFAIQECYTLTNIYYPGTKDQWTNLDKESSWFRNIGTGAVVHCSDGDVAL
ncbi:MAG: leucine-rich repeat domain-containing protein [Treponema sp.]|uniref:leucine-rich repeat domain-containing protein n=1 Tax=Treponema sp. TaxID=166 RepID=UPI0025D341EC|nr:leucine-rich repeat domain-containing protein [Treponema sp.]MBQ8681121.1 leucine-rich repeat domain-containing protein [Treponema sp.]